jgi:glycosyltransferase involved in cell wall biosynthesis
VPAGELEVAVVYPGVTFPRVDAIRAYSRRLVSELDRSPGVAPSLHEEIDANLPAELAETDLVVVQYNPLAYGRQGFAPRLPWLLWRVRRRRERPVIAITVHETFYSLDRVRWWVPGLWQRAQLAAVCHTSDLVGLAIGRWRSDLGWLGRRRPTVHLPVGSNLPDARRYRADERGRLGADETTIVAATFGAAHALRMVDWVVDSANAICSDGLRVILLNLAAEPPRIAGLDPGIRLETPGELDALSLARKVAAADLFLLPWRDGASTKRSTLMSGLQHAVPVISTRGRHTDPVLAEAQGAMRLVEVDRKKEFVAAARELAGDRGARRRIGDAGRRLYEEELDWPVLAERLLDHAAALSARWPSGPRRG